MKFYAPNVEKTLRRSVRDRLRTSRKLWRQYRAHSRGRRSITANLGILWFALVVIAVGARWMIASDIRYAPSALGTLAIVLFLTSRALGGSGRLLHTLQTETWLLFYFPIADATLFQRQWRRYVLSSLWIFFLSAGAFAFLEWDRAPLERVLFWACVGGILHWAIVLTAVAWLAARASIGWLPMVSGALSLLSLLLLIFPQFSAPFAAQVINVALGATPSGWVYWGCREALTGAAWMALLPAIGVAAMALTISDSQARLRSQFAPKEIEFPMGGNEADQEWEAYSDMEADHVDGLDARFRILRRKFLEQPQRSPLLSVEFFAFRWLSSRERLVAQFATGGDPAWTWMWKRAAIIAVVGLLGLLLPSGWGVGVIVGSGAVAAMFAAPLLGGQWAAFQAGGFGTSFVSAYSVFPIGFWEMARVMLKINTVRCAFWLPLLAVSSVAFAWKAGADPFVGLGWALRLGLLIVVMQPLTLIFKWSQGTNDTTAAKLRMSVVGFCALGAAGGALVLVIGSFDAEAGSLVTTLASAGVGAAGSLGALGVYGNSFNRNKFDLMPRPR